MSERDDDRDLLAAEHALRLLDGRDLDEARALAQRDSSFAAMAAAWDERFAPLFNAIEPVEVDASVWSRIAAAIGRRKGEGAEVIALRRRATGWRNFAGLVTAIAAALALVVLPDVIRPDRSPSVAPVAPSSQPTLMAKVVSEDRATAFVVAYLPDKRELLVTPAIAGLPQGKDHELWLIGASGVPVSMGVVDDAAPTRLIVPPTHLAEIKVAVTMAVTVEPDGGSPTGQPTSAPVAAGPLVEI
ncbi:MAG: anti-sigma factor [Sphingomicrobium sp.]